MTVKVVRGMENRTIAKRQQEGWEFIGQSQGTLRAELRFRRLVRKVPTRLLAIAAGVLAVLLVIGVGMAIVAGQGDDAEPTASPTSSDVDPTEEPSDEPSEEPAEPETSSTTPPEASPTPEPEEYRYNGPEYEIVATDANQGPANLMQHWVLTDVVDYSTNAYKDQIKAIVADVARTAGSADLIVQVVSLKEVALAEAASTYEDFIDEHGMDYAINVIPKKEVQHWIASYTGGFNPNTGKPSDAESAFEIIWRPYATTEIERWKPEVE